MSIAKGHPLTEKLDFLTGYVSGELLIASTVHLISTIKVVYFFCFSHCPLLPGQIFLIEITDSQDGWSGHLRLGVTQCNPFYMTTIPEMVIPDMTATPKVTDDQREECNNSENRTWAVAITKFHNRIRFQSKEIQGIKNEITSTDRIACFANQNIPLQNLYFYGRKELTFSSSGERFPNFGQSTFIGSRIGIVLIPVDDDTKLELYKPGDRIPSINNPSNDKCNMHLIINGEDQGPSVTNIALDRPLFALIDVYSITKRVNIVASSALSSLKDLCRDNIRSRVHLNKDCECLPLPKALKQFCRFL